MGSEAQCRLRYEGKVSAGRVLLETDALIFRGDARGDTRGDTKGDPRGNIRLTVPLHDIRRVEVSGGDLSVSFSDRTAVFDLGTKAAAWAEKIRNPKTVLDKLAVKGG